MELLVEPVLPDVAIRADGYVEMRAVGACEQVLGPVVVDRAGRELEDRLAGQIPPEDGAASRTQ